MDKNNVKEMSEAFTKGLSASLKALRGEVVDEDPLQIAIRERAGITSAATLPKPLDLGNFQVVKDPHMWILFFAKTKVARGHFRSEFGTQGVLLQAFDVALGVAFPGASLFERRTLCDIFMQVGMIFINHPAAQGVDDLFLTLGSCLNSATHYITLLDERLIVESLGVSAGLLYKTTRLKLDPLNFACGASEAIRSVLRSARPKFTGEKRERGNQGQRAPRQCNRCGESIPPGGNFRDHRTVCKGKK